MLFEVLEVGMCRFLEVDVMSEGFEQLKNALPLATKRHHRLFNR